MKINERTTSGASCHKFQCSWNVMDLNRLHKEVPSVTAEQNTLFAVVSTLLSVGTVQLSNTPKPDAQHVPGLEIHNRSMAQFGLLLFRLRAVIAFFFFFFFFHSSQSVLVSGSWLDLQPLSRCRATDTGVIQDTPAVTRFSVVASHM